MHDENPLVSIAMATYNGERFLRKQLDSIYAQTYQNIEVVVCDDYSSDRTVEILEEYKQKKGLFYYKNRQNLGYFKNFEKVLGLCEGKYIALADQDDIWLPNKIERLILAINGYSLIYSDARYIDEDDRVFAESVRTYTGLPVQSGKPLKYLTFNSFIIGCTCLFRKELLSSALPFPEGERYHDWWLSLVACTQQGILYLDEPLIEYRNHGKNTLGLKKKSGVWKKWFGFLYYSREIEILIIQQERLQSLIENRIFTEKERHFICLAKDFYSDRINHWPHFKAFLIALRNWKYIFPGYPVFFVIKAATGVLFR